MNSIEKLAKELKKRKYQSIAILGHTSADPDSIASAFGMGFIVNKLQKNSNIDILIDGISAHANMLIEYYEEEYLTETAKDYDLIIIVDVNVLTQLGSFQELIEKHQKEKIIIIDHHVPTDFSKQIFLSLIQEEKSSTAEIVTSLIFTLKLNPPKKLLTVLLSGMIYDNRRFYTLNQDLLLLVQQMLTRGADYDTAIKLLQKKMDISERIARLKCASRLSLHQIQNRIIVWSRVASYEGSSARAFLELGADIAFIYSLRKKITRLTLRATQQFYIDSGVNFAKSIMQKLGEFYEGEGGGHSTAAAVTIPKEIQENDLQKEVFKLLERLLKQEIDQS